MLEHVCDSRQNSKHSDYCHSKSTSHAVPKTNYWVAMRSCLTLHLRLQ